MREVAWPYSEVDETDRAVSAGKYGTGTVLIPPFREYLALAQFKLLLFIKVRHVCKVRVRE